MISLQDFVDRTVDKDYSTKQWSVQREEIIEEQERKHSEEVMDPHLKAFPRSLAQHKWSTKKICEKLQQKIVERTKRASDQFREGGFIRVSTQRLLIFAAYAMFGSPIHGITPEMFKKQLTSLGFVLTQPEVNKLFAEFDTDGMLLSLQFCQTRLNACNGAAMHSRRLWQNYVFGARFQSHAQGLSGRALECGTRRSNSQA